MKNSHLKLATLAPIMDISRISTATKSAEIRTCNNLIYEDSFITKESKLAAKLWDYFADVREKGEIPDYFHADGIRTILIGGSSNDAFHLAAEMIPIGVEGQIYQNEDFYTYDGRGERREQGVSIGNLWAGEKIDILHHQMDALKTVVDSVMISNIEIKEKNAKALNGRHFLEYYEAFDLPLLAKNYFTNTFVFYGSDDYDRFAKGEITEEELINGAMDAYIIKNLVMKYGFDVLVVPPKTDEDYLELLRAVMSNDKLTQDDLTQIKKELYNVCLSEETLYNYLRFVKRDSM